jgi:leucyl-tRNA synthetase
MVTRTKYQPSEIEPKWQTRWAEEGIFLARDDDPRPKYYNLVMLPYPSGDLHIGHWYNYSGADMYGRFMRMRGYNVSQPIGFDAFGLPAENAAIKRNVQPRAWTLDNIANMRRQLTMMGAGWDWPREIVSCLPDYYKWTEWLFLQFYQRGLAYRKKAPANWCPSCNTTLANEQVVDDHCERCGTLVEQRELEQWLFRITAYAEELLRFDGLDWPEKTRLMQTNWIGRSEGAEIRFTAKVPSGARSGKARKVEGAEAPAQRDALEEHAGRTRERSEEQSPALRSGRAPELVEIPVFTTRPDTIYGVTFFVLAPEHPLVERLTAPEQHDAVRAYVERARHETEIERLSTDVSRPKTGVPLGTSVRNPVSGAEVPIWISDYVLMSYGTGAVMGVPAHDQRDFEFAHAFGLPITQVIAKEGEEPSDTTTWESAQTAKGVMVNSGPFDGTPAQEGIQAVIAWCKEHDAGRAAVTYHLRDWLVSRQRYWGSPIPIVYCPEHGTVPVPEDQLPVLLPEEVQFKPTGESPLRYVPEFLHTTCPICGGPATRETDTLDTFLCSSWYFLRYMDAYNDERAWDPEKIAHWLPVDFYIGGPEHATMHLLYARFFVKALRDMGLLGFDEPFTRLYHQGMVLGPDGQKMSKSRGNVIAPDNVVQRYGADTVRCYLMFMGPFDQGGPWSNQGIEGVWRFMNRVWALLSDVIEAKAQSQPVEIAQSGALERLRHKAIARVTSDFGDLRFNTALAVLMELVNGLNKAREEQPDMMRDPAFARAAETLLVLLAPMAPHIAEELWRQLGHEESIHRQDWPAFDPALTVDEVITVVVQVNGRLRDRLEVAPDTSEDEIRRLALASPKVQAALAGRAARNFIYVPGRLANVVG